MKNKDVCPACSMTIPEDAPAGMCPECLLAAGISHEVPIVTTARDLQRADNVFERGEFLQALALAERALDLRQKALGPDHPDLAECYQQLADIHRQLGQTEAAAAYERRLQPSPEGAEQAPARSDGTAPRLPAEGVE